MGWLGKTPLAVAMSNQKMYALVDTIHQLGMVLLLGTISIVSLRLLGMVLRARRVSQLASDVRRGTAVGLAIMLTTGPLLFVSEPVRWYTNGPFQLMMAILLAAIVFHFT